MNPVLLVEDDPSLSLGLAQLLAQRGHDVIVCSDSESAESVLEGVNVGAVITDMRLSSPFRYEGLDLVRHARRLSPNARVIGMSGSGTDGLAEATALAGATFFAKPFELEALESALMPFRGSVPGDMIVVPTLDRIIAEKTIVPLFQPIVGLAAREVFGYEALARVRSGAILSNPDALFRYADRKNGALELNFACLERALVAGASLARNAVLFVNVDPRVFAAGPRLFDLIVPLMARLGIDATHIVLEITEQHAFPDDSITFSTI